MQLRYVTSVSLQEYVNTQKWREATLAHCPNHPQGGCSLTRHGTYTRKSSYGLVHIQRWYCRESGMTFSALPDCLAAQVPGTLEELEQAVASIEQCDTFASAAKKARPSDVYEPLVAERWLRRRRSWLNVLLLTVKTLLPDYFTNAAPTVTAMRAALGTPCLLLTLRCHCRRQLHFLPAPLGFADSRCGFSDLTKGRQQFVEVFSLPP